MSKRIQIQLYNSKTGESLTLPLNPETTDLEKSKSIKTFNILGYGEVSIKGDTELQRITLQNLLPDENTFLASLATYLKNLEYKPYKLQDTIDMLNRWVDNDAIIQVIISDRLNKKFRIAKYVDQLRESVKDSGYTIELVEYRNPTDKEGLATIQSKAVKLKSRIIDKYIPNQKVMQRGQTAYQLCKLTYGGKVNEFAKLNAIKNVNAPLTGAIVEMLPLDDKN